MKKFSLFILALLCLCANAWAVDVSSFGSDPLNYYYLKNTEHNNQYVQVLSSAINNQWYKTVASSSEATSFSIDKYNYSTHTWPTAFSFVDGGTTYWLGENKGNTQKSGSYFAWTAENKGDVKFELKHNSDHDRHLNDNGETLEVPQTGGNHGWIYWAVEAKSTNNETTYYLYNKGQQAFLANDGGKAAVTTNPAQAAKIVINKFSVSPIQFYGTSNYLYQAAGTSSSSTTALDFAIYAGNGGFYLYNENGSEGGFLGIGSGTNKRYLSASSNNGDCVYPKDEVGNNSTWYFISEDDFTLLSAIISYENAVAAAPSPSDYTYLTTELATALNSAKEYSFDKNSSVSDVNAAINGLRDAVEAADNYMFINGKELVETNCLNGWTEVTESMPGTPSNYYFAIVSAQTRKALMAGKKSDNQELSYQNISDPTSDLYKTWMIEQSTNGSYSGAFVFRSLANVDEITTATGSDPYNLLVSSTSANGTFKINDNEEAAHYLIFDKGVWKIRNGRISSPLYYWGAWDNARYIDGERIAGNAGGNTNESASFYIYSIPKADYIAKYIANSQTDLNFAVRNRGFLYNGSVSPYWEGTGSDKATAFAPQTGGNNSFDNGSTFAEMWVGNNTIMSAGDIHQTVSLPAGTYTLSADVVSSGITSYLYASYRGGSPISVECSGIGSKTTKTITFVVSSKQNVTIGYRHDGCSATSGSKWVAIDNVTLTYVGAYVAPSGNDNSDWICPQGTCASYQETGATETYGGNGTNFQVGKVMYQHRTGLPNGRYRVRFYAVASAAQYNPGNVAFGADKAQAFAQSSTQAMTIVSQYSCTPTDHLYEFEVSVTNGTLEFGIKNIAEGGNWYVAKLDAITYIAPFTVTTNANGWASFCPSYDVAVPTGITVYSGTYHSNATNSWLSLNEQSVSSIAAGDGVLLFGEPSTNYIFEWTSSATKIAGNENDLKGSTERIANPSPSSVYVLGTREGETALYKYTGAYIPANKAYLELPGGSPAPSIRIVASPEISTSIENIESENIGTLDWTQPVYNVMGLQVSKGATGVLIQNGQKFYVW